MADVAALTSIAKSALQLITSLAKDESLLLWNSEKELQRLMHTVEIITCLLRDADKMQSTTEAVQTCLSRLRGVMYDAEDLFDELVSLVLRKRTMSGNAFTKEVRLCFSKSNQLFVLYKTAHEVKSLRESLDSIEKDMKLCGFEQSPPVVQQLMRVDRQNFKTHYFVHKEDVIGREEDTNRIVNMLLPKDEGETSDGRSLAVVAVIGFGGLGKTTVAQFVYNYERVQNSFDVCLWACINYLSNLEQVLIEIIASKEEKPTNLSLVKLQEKLREIIGGRKFLLVLDDVWDDDETSWFNLECILRCGRSGSKVLVTTRSTKVAECLDALKPYCELAGLSKEHAWSLFQKKAFDECELNKYPELEQIGMQIVHKCGYVPLAIVIIGRLLRHKAREVKIWSDFLDNKLMHALSNTGDTRHGSIKGVLKVSYDDLRPNLKLCFASCSLFPKDHVFDKDELVRLWLSQGFLKSCTYNTHESLEELGGACFFELVERCFFQLEAKYPQIPSYWIAKMHDLLHDLAIDIAKTEICFLDKLPKDKVRIDGLRHISVGSRFDDAFDYCSLVSHPKTVRTFLFQNGPQLSNNSLDMLLESFRMLRTLCLPNSGIDHVSDSIGELIHLRFLDLSGNEELKHLPVSICKLHHLMFFILEGCEVLEKLPQKIERLVSLRQLNIEGCDRLDSLPPGLKALTSLVNLDRVIVNRHIGGLGYLNKLDSLCGSVQIELPREGWPDAIEDAKQSSMSNKHKLNEMNICWEGDYNTAQKMGKYEAREVMEALEPHGGLERLKIMHYDGEKLPGWLCTLKNVGELCLNDCRHVEYLEDEIKGKSSCFPSLKLLTVVGMTNLKGWWRQEIGEETQRPCLPNVSQVTIRNCPELKGQMPLLEGIRYLDLEGVDVKFVKELLLVNPTLSSLSLSSIEGLISLPEEWIRHLTALQKLQIGQIDSDWYCKVSGRGLAHLTALKHLEIHCGEIGDEDEMGNEEGMQWKALQGLERLHVAVGNKHLLVDLEYLTRLEYLVVDKWTKIEEDSVELKLKGLQNLRFLMTGFDGKTCDLHKAGIQYLHSLTHLHIKSCKELYLCWKTIVSMKLQTLWLYDVERVIDVEDDMMMTAGEQQSLLRRLEIRGGAAEECVDDIPWTSLSYLEVLSLDGMGEREQLPDGIQHLTSLQILSICGCEKVRSLPNWIPQLISLTYLKILGCSEELERRCERERGEDWPLIRHLRVVHIATKSSTTSQSRGEEEGIGKMGWCGGLTISKFYHKSQ